MRLSNPRLAAQRERELHGQRRARVSSQTEPLKGERERLVLARVQRRGRVRERRVPVVRAPRSRRVLRRVACGAPLAAGRADGSVGGVRVARADDSAVALRDAHGVLQHAHQSTLLREAQGLVAEHLGARRRDGDETRVARKHRRRVHRLELDVLVRARAHQDVDEGIRAQRHARTRAVQGEVPTGRAAGRRRRAVARRAEARARVHGGAQRRERDGVFEVFVHTGVGRASVAHRRTTFEICRGGDVPPDAAGGLRERAERAAVRVRGVQVEHGLARAGGRAASRDGRK